MDLGTFSVSLTVKDIKASKAFYEKLGFSEKSGTGGDDWTVMSNGTCTIGLFQGMFDKNILTFNPGWDKNANPVDPFEDVRELQKKLKAEGLELIEQADENSSGPAYFTLIDPDGNPILVDQHR